MKRAKILIVDDERLYINVLVELLQDDYELIIAKDGAQALQRLEDEHLPDLILLDWLMPGEDGLQTCQRIKADPRSAEIPIIFLTIKSEVEDEISGFSCGAIDYIRKPISPPVVRARIQTHLQLQQMRAALESRNEDLQHWNLNLEQAVQERTEELEKTKDVAIHCMASLAETRDNETGFHIRRTQNYVRLLAQLWRELPGNHDKLSDKQIALLYKSAPLHDIGKVGVPDRILLKPGKLDAEEWQEMKKHPLYGYEAIVRAEQELGTSSFLTYAKEIAKYHHEQWDGSGYPEGLQGEAIPLSGRLMALADVFDALISKRVYKPAFEFELALEMIRDKRGTHFDPVLVDLFMEHAEQFKAIAEKYADT